MRFDDSLETVLAADMASPFGAQAAWRQVVDLVGRGRVAATDDVMARLRAIRDIVPPPVRAASARALAAATPPAALVALFAEDESAIAAPVLRAAQLSSADWCALLPMLSPAGRSILRHRRDLSADVVRALESFGRVDFVLSAPSADTVEATPPRIAVANDVEPRATPAADVEDTIVPSTPFLSIATIAAGLPVVAQARRQTESKPAAARTPVSLVPPVGSDQSDGTFQISELLARIDAYQREREPVSVSTGASEFQQELFADAPRRAETFRFETDASGVLRWIEGAARAPLIGLGLHLATAHVGSRVDGVAAGAFRRRTGFANARLLVDGTSDAAGQWRITGVPVFERATGRFTGYRGSARRPRPDETTEPPHDQRNPAADVLRQLVHELRTPTNAIAGFAEMIDSQMLGPVPEAYRAQAATIRSQASGLLGAIDDIDMAARIETHALDLRPGDVAVAPLLDRILTDLAPLAALRGTTVHHSVADDALAILGDDRAVERLIARLTATLVASGSLGERICVVASREDATVAIVFDRPAALAAYAEQSLLTIDAEAESERDGSPLLGTGFALRLARNLAAELRGSLMIGEKALTLRLPAAFSEGVEQVSTN